jgi:hypothetical protein
MREVYDQSSPRPFRVFATKETLTVINGPHATRRASRLFVFDRAALIYFLNSRILGKNKKMK